MKYRDITIQSRIGGEVVKAKLFECDQCGASEFLIYDVGGHPHLQCVKCDTTFCQGDCAGAEQFHLSRQ